jgi:hypothetical protein
MVSGLFLIGVSGMGGHKIVNAFGIGAFSSDRRVSKRYFVPMVLTTPPTCPPGFFDSNRPGYILYTVLIILSILGIFSSIVVVSLRTTENGVRAETKKYQARLLAESGIARAEYFLNGGDGHDIAWETDSLIESMEDAGILGIACRRFGAYAKIVCSGTHLNASCIMTGIFGRHPPDTLAPVITLTGSVRGLVVCAPMLLQGTVILRTDSVYRADAGGGKLQKARGPSIRTINRASDSLPFSPAPLDGIFSEMQWAFARTAVDSNAIRGNLTVSGPNDTLIGKSRIAILGDCTLERVTIDNRAITITGTLTLGDSVNCNFCTFIANKTEIKSGVTDKCLFYSKRKQTVCGGFHDSQFFSEDSIVVGRNARLEAMTLLVSRKNIERLRSDTVLRGGIFFEEQGTYQGSAICYCDSSALKGSAARGSLISMGNSCSFTGYLITDGDIELGNDDIEGHLWVRTLVGRKDANKRGNWLYARSIRPLRREMPFPLLGGLPVKLRKSETSCDYRLVRGRGDGGFRHEGK